MEMKLNLKQLNQEYPISQNIQKMKKNIKEFEMKLIYKEFQDTGYKKTLSIDTYKKFITIYRNHWDTIWNFYNLNRVQKLEFDTFINKKKAIHIIARKFVPKRKKKRNVPRKYTKRKNKKYMEKERDNNEKPYIDKEFQKEHEFKPQLIFFGKGNGTMTISNLRNSGPKGPIKLIAIELSKLCIVILVDEYNTSQFCSSCMDTKLEHPDIQCKMKRTIRIIDKKTKEIRKGAQRFGVR